MTTAAMTTMNLVLSDHLLPVWTMGFSLMIDLRYLITDNLIERIDKVFPAKTTVSRKAECHIDGSQNHSTDYSTDNNELRRHDCLP
ncbi:hypothetical protein D3C86_1922740 [compost metagenome]